MLAALYVGNETFRLEQRQFLLPGPGEVRLEVAYVGICGTDLHIKHGAMDGRVAIPAVIGHEMSGTVAAVGEGVSRWSPGDRVTVMPLDWCGRCPACVAGHQHVCQNLVFVGIDSSGAMQQAWTVPERLLVRLPPGLGLEFGALAASLLGDALIAGGLPVAEITFRTSVAIHAIEMLARDPRFTIGAGTVLSPADVDRALGAGAQFIVSPGLDAEVVRRCRELGVATIPGVATPSEAMAALRQGLDTLKLFPAQPLGGMRWLNALAAPFPDLRFVPTGGIGSAELAEYARHPAVSAVGGSWIAPRALLRSGEFDEIARLAAEAVAIVTAARQAEGAPA